MMSGEVSMPSLTNQASICEDNKKDNDKSRCVDDGKYLSKVSSPSAVPPEKYVCENSIQQSKVGINGDFNTTIVNMSCSDTKNNSGKRFPVTSSELHDEDILSSMLSTSSYSFSRNTDRLLGSEGDTRMLNLRKQVSLALTGTCTSVVDSPNLNTRDFKWPTTCANGIDVMRSPTLSMADIAVIVPSNLTPETTDIDPFSNIDDYDMLAGQVNGVQCVDSDGKESTRSNIDQLSTKSKRNKLPFWKQVSETKKRQPNNSTSIKRSNHKGSVQERNCEKPTSGTAAKSINPTKAALVPNQANSNDLLSPFVELAGDKPLNGVGSGCVNSGKADVHSQVPLGSGADSDKRQGQKVSSVDDFEAYDASEWQFVGSKQKRRQNQSLKPPSPPNKRELRVSKSTANFQRRKPIPERRPSQSKVAQSTKQRVTFTRPMARSQPQAADSRKSNSPTQAVTAVHVERLPPKSENLESTHLEIPSTQNDDVNISPNQVTAQSQLHQSSLDKVKPHSMQHTENIETEPRVMDTLESAPTNAVVANPDISHPQEDISKGGETDNTVVVPGAMKQAIEDPPAEPATNLHPVPIPTGPQLEGEELLKQLKRQLEYYFSRENLSQDSYLVSQMDNQQYVPVWTIANFNAVKKLTSDIDQVILALKDSEIVEVDEERKMMRPKQRRCIVILRDVAMDVRREQVAALFNDATCQFTSCEFVGNGSWFVMFETENDAQLAYRHLRENVREFNGKPIMARIKSKTHHLNPYTNPPPAPQTQEAPTVNPEQPAASTAPPMPPQVPPAPIEYIQQPPFIFCPPHHFATSAHTGAHATAPPFIARVAAPNPSTVATSGPAQASAVALNAPFGGIVMAPWAPATGLFPASDPNAVVGSQFATGQFITSYKANPIPQQHYQSTSASNKPPHSTGHRFTEFRKEINQRGTYAQRKSSSGSYQQQQQPHSTSQPITQPRYILTTDPNPPAIMPDMVGHYVQSEHSTTHVAHSLAGHPPTHYLPAVNPMPAPFVTPNANDPNLVVVPKQQMIIPHGSAHNRSTPRRAPVQSFHPAHRPQTTHQITHHGSISAPAAGGQKNRYSTSRSSSHSSSHSYQPEVGPRFLQKGVNHPQQQQQPYSSGGYLHQTNPPYIQKALVSATESYHSSGHDYKLTYSNKAISSAYPPHEQMSSQRSRTPTSHADKAFSSADTIRGHGATDEVFSNTPGEHNNNHAKRNTSRSSNGSVSATNPTSNNAIVNGEQRNMHQSGLDPRRNSRLRRTRRNEDDRATFSASSPPPPGNTSFNLESNSFPPLPGAPEPGSAPPTPSSEAPKPAAAAIVKGLETIKTSVPESPPMAAPQPKKYSEVSSASHVTKNPPQQKAAPAATTEASTKPVKKPESKPKSAPAVNTQPVTDKHPPATNKRPVHHSKPAAEKARPDPPKPVRASTAPVSQASTVTTKKTTRPAHTPVARKDSRKSAPPPPPLPAQKKDAAKVKEEKPEEEKPPKNTVDAKVVEKKDAAKAEVPQEDDESQDAGDRKPTYAEMLKMKQKAAAAAQMNGKASSDSGKSDSGEDTKSGDDAREADAKNSAEGGTDVKVAGKQRADEDEKISEKREGMVNGNSRRGDHEYRRGSWHRYRDGHNDYRGNRPRDWNYNNERGNGPREYRGRGGGPYRGRRGGYRDRYYGNNGPRPIPNGQVPAER